MFGAPTPIKMSAYATGTLLDVAFHATVGNIYVSGF